jgi:hypothetical protein
MIITGKDKGGDPDVIQPEHGKVILHSCQLLVEIWTKNSSMNGKLG